MKGAILANALIFLLAFLHISDIAIERPFTISLDPQQFFTVPIFYWKFSYFIGVFSSVLTNKWH